MSDIPVICMSYQRAGEAKAVHAIRPLILCVTASEEAAYREAYPNHELLVHPDEIRGYCPTKQWIWDRFDYRVFTMDDDISEMRRVYDPDQKPHMTADEGYDAIQATGAMAEDIGAKLWGLANYTMSYAYDVFQPFRMVGYVNGMSHGVLPGLDIRLPNDPHFFGSDYYVSALNAYKHRYMWIDTRYGFYQTKTFRNPGGLSEFRTLDREEASFNELQRLFGPDVIKLKGKRGGRPPATSAARKQSEAGHPFEKLLSIPW